MTTSTPPVFFPAPACLLKAHDLVMEHQWTDPMDGPCKDLANRMKQKHTDNQYCLGDLHAWALSLSGFLYQLQATDMSARLKDFITGTSGNALSMVHAFVVFNESQICTAMSFRLSECKRLQQKWQDACATDNDVYMWADHLFWLLRTVHTSATPIMQTIVNTMQIYARGSSDLGKRVREEA